MGWRDGRVLKTTLHAAEAGNVDGTIVDVSDLGLLAIQVIAAASWDGTLNFEASVDGAAFANIQGEQIDDGTLVVTATGTTLAVILRFDVSGLRRFKAVITGRTVGTVTVTGQGVPT